MKALFIIVIILNFSISFGESNYFLGEVEIFKEESDSLESEQGLKLKIKSIKTDKELNRFLLSYGLIPNKEKHDTITHFHANSINVDIFYKNLFGSDQDEIIIQIRDKEAYSLNIFYYQGAKFKKIPGQLARYFGGGMYLGENFVFYFENVFKENEFCIITKYRWGYNRSESEEVIINKIESDTILQLYSFEPNSSSYSGSRDLYFSETDYKFRLLNNSYPKALIKITSFHKEYVKRANDMGDIFSGTISDGYIDETIIIKDNGTELGKSIKHEKTQKFISSLAEIVNMKSKCDTNTTIYITEDFFSKYLLDTSQTPAFKYRNRYNSDGDIGYYKCCNVYLKDKILFTETIDSTSGNLNISKFTLKLSLLNYFKPEIKPENLYYYKKRYPNENNSLLDTSTVVLDNIIYLSNGEKFHDKNSEGVLNLGDPSLIFCGQSYWYNSIEYISVCGAGIPIAIPVKKISPYLKPEALELFKDPVKNK